MRLRTLLLVLAVAATAVVAFDLPSAVVPVKCKTTDVTPDGRVFPEPLASQTYLAFDEFECGVALLERTFPDRLEVTVVGESVDGHPVYDVLMTHETAVGPKQDLLVMSSIHGDEIGPREGAARQIEDLADPALLGDEDWVSELLDRYVVHWVFPNPDGWVNGELVLRDEAGISYTRENDEGIDLNRNFPVHGYFAYTDPDYFQPEGDAVAEVFRKGDWYLGTDNHGQLNDTYLAAGLQIVGEFDYQKSETLARFADGIADAMRDYQSTAPFEQLRDLSGGDLGGYHWGTLYDMLGYSASGSGIDYYNTPTEIGGYGFATEMTLAKQLGTNRYTHFPLLNQVWVDSIRAINTTMFKQAIEPETHTFPVASRTAYLFDPERITDTDFNGAGYQGGDPGGFGQAHYDVSRMKFFEDLNEHASEPVTPVRIGDVMDGTVDLGGYESLVIANDAVPEPVADAAAWYGLLSDFVAGGGNLVLTDAALQALPALVDGIAPDDVFVNEHYVGSVEEFTDRSHPLNEGLRGVASQTYDTVPIGYAFGGSNNSAPNWKVARDAWEAAGGFTAGTYGSDETIYGEIAVGEGSVRILGALLPDPTEEFYHPFGLQNYAVTYTGYTLLANMLELPGS